MGVAADGFVRALGQPCALDTQSPSLTARRLRCRRQYRVPDYLDSGEVLRASWRRQRVPGAPGVGPGKDSPWPGIIDRDRGGRVGEFATVGAAAVPADRMEHSRWWRFWRHQRGGRGWQLAGERLIRCRCHRNRDGLRVVKVRDLHHRPDWELVAGRGWCAAGAGRRDGRSGADGASGLRTFAPEAGVSVACMPPAFAATQPAAAVAA